MLVRGAGATYEPSGMSVIDLSRCAGGDLAEGPAARPMVERRCPKLARMYAFSHKTVGDTRGIATCASQRMGEIYLG